MNCVADPDQIARCLYCKGYIMPPGPCLVLADLPESFAGDHEDIKEALEATQSTIMRSRANGTRR